MKNLISTLSIALAFGTFVAASQPAHAQFFDNTFENPQHVSAPAQTPAPPPAQTSQTVRTVEKAPLIVIENAGSPSHVRITEWTRDRQWTLPVSSPSDYHPMQ